LTGCTADRKLGLLCIFNLTAAFHRDGIKMATLEFQEAVDFLRRLGNVSLPADSDEKIEKFWRAKMLPLCLTDDFNLNWSHFHDDDGQFVDKRGARFRIEPKPHMSAQCTTNYAQGPEQRCIQTTYAPLSWLRSPGEPAEQQ
jgi:hypothetical protein